MADVGAALAFARAQIGKPYRWGGTGPNSWDCSGLVQAAWRAGGVELPRTTREMVLKGTPVKRADLQPGDLVFPDPGHVQLYAGGGNIIEAPRTGENVKERAMWGFWTARRVTPANTASSDGGGASVGSLILQGGKTIADGTNAVVDHIPGVGTVKAVTGFTTDVGHFLGLLTQPNTWVRFGKFIVGAGLIGIGLSMQKPLQDVASGITSAAMNVAAPEVKAATSVAGAAKTGAA